MAANRFKRKLTGATAELFAAVCEHYMEAAASDCNDKPIGIPIFSRLSPQQRVKLVRDVVVGMLCENEPMPPDTIQHVAAYRAVVLTLFTELEIEEDTCEQSGDVGEDLLHPRTPRTRFSEEEIKERSTHFSVVDARAVRNKKKLDRKSGEDEDFEVEEEEFDVSSAHALERFTGAFQEIFSGPSIPPEERASMRPLTDSEKLVFRWRRLADAALQQCHSPAMGIFPPLCHVDFDWRCRNMGKWQEALNLLLVSEILNEGSPTERALITGCVNSRSYADPSQHARIRAIDKHVNTLRAVYDSTWKPESLGDDQRCIYAVCAEEFYHSEDHCLWATSFVQNCIEQHINFLQRGQYQKRLDLYRKMKPDFEVGVTSQFTAWDQWCPPKDYKEDCGHVYVRCNGPGEPFDLGGKFIPNTFGCRERENLMPCAQCKVVRYCSRECQVKDWHNHKKDCKKMALLRKDKKKVAEIAKEL